MDSTILKKLKQSILEYDAKQSVQLAKTAVEGGGDPLEVVRSMTEAISMVGDGFEKGDLWLPDLIGAGEAMAAAMPIVEKEILKAGLKRESAGTIVVGTVKGDIHSIGKDMVSVLLKAGGFTVYDLGVNVALDAFMKAIEEYDPDILCMSALLTSTVNGRLKVGHFRSLKVGHTPSFAERHLLLF